MKILFGTFGLIAGIFLTYVGSIPLWFGLCLVTVGTIFLMSVDARIRYMEKDIEDMQKAIWLLCKMHTIDPKEEK